MEETKNIIAENAHHCISTPIDHSPEQDGPLSGFSITAKDCICVKNVETTSSSAILRTYKPPFDATVIEKIREAGGQLVGKTVQDEFGFGSFCINVGKGITPPTNPHDQIRVCGGSSGGSAGITAQLGDKHISLAESTGGSIAAPAALCGVVGLTPTYGLVSRYGLISYGNSLDKIGPMATSVKNAALGLRIIAGHDEKDSTSVKRDPVDYTKSVGKSVKGMKVGVITSLVKASSESIQKEIQRAIDTLKKKGVEVKDISLPLVEKAGISAYYLIAMCEASSNLAKYCGLRYGPTEKLEGNFNDFFSSVRSTHFGDEAKRRLLLGTFARMSGFRDAYYLKALKVRTLIIEEYKKALAEVDALLSPTMTMVAPTFEEVKKLTPAQHYAMDLCVAPVNLAGLPHISLPFGKENNMPIGLLLTANHFREEDIIALASQLEEEA